MGGMADADDHSAIDAALDELYAGAPEEFTGLRTTLVAAAKKRGDKAAAKRIGQARKPTMAAAVVNRLVHRDAAVAPRIADLGERLRAAHEAMDGEQIRLLSAEQRHLVAELSRAAFTAAEVASPSAALRDDVTGTLQAAIADPDVSAQLGRLTKAEQWSGFGGFGESAVVTSTAKQPAKKPAGTPARTPVSTPDRTPAKKAAEVSRESGEAAAQAERERRERARAVVAAAEQAKADADDALAERQTDLATARLRHDDARARLAKAEQALRDAEGAYEDAKRASREAGQVVAEAKAQLPGRK